MEDGRAGRAGPQRDRSFCFTHDPERAEDAGEARRLGGLRCRKEGTVALAYDLQALDTVEGIRRILEIAVTDGLSLDNGVARVRLLISAASAAGRLLETAELETRVAALEEAARTVRLPPPMDRCSMPLRGSDRAVADERAGEGPSAGGRW